MNYHLLSLIGYGITICKDQYDDLPEYFTDPKNSLKYLYSWMPNLELYRNL